MLNIGIDMNISETKPVVGKRKDESQLEHLNVLTQCEEISGICHQWGGEGLGKGLALWFTSGL